VLAYADPITDSGAVAAVLTELVPFADADGVHLSAAIRHVTALA
jgi:hypothetical protein